MGSHGSPHVVMVPIDPAGHFIPFLQFASSLAAEGITVTFVASDSHFSKLIVRGDGSPHSSYHLRFLELGDASKHLTSHELLAERNTQAEREKTVKLLMELITDISSPNAQLLRGVPTAAFPVCVLHDMMSCWAQEAAERLQIERHLLYVSAVSALSCTFQSERLAREGRVPLTPETQSVPIADIPGLPPLQPRDLPSLFLSAETYKWMKYNDYRMAMADVVLTNSFYGLEKRAIVALQEEVIGTGAGVKVSLPRHLRLFMWDTVRRNMCLT
ncbi:UDP-glycosyltransferase 72B1-like [Physcomitrium patens]|uniref:UDP-glycosyltransferase 72B1-like n=1 Tax=Physcomitrium patens TaxID=3218 RepID=UPI003CCD4DA1